MNINNENKDDEGRLRPLGTTFKTCNFFHGMGQFLRLRGPVLTR